MRIGIIFECLEIAGGGERQAIMLARALLEQGDEVTLYTLSVNCERCFPSDIASLRIVTPSTARRLSKSKIRFFGLLFQKIDELRRARELALLLPDDLDAINPHEMFAAKVAYFYKRRHPHVRSIMMLNDVYTASWSLLDDPLFGPKPRSFFARIRGAIIDRFDQIYVRAQDIVLVLNERSIALAKRYLRVNARVIRSAADVEHFQYKARAPIAAGRPIEILASGIMYVHRRYEDTIRAVALLRRGGLSVRLRIIGEWNHKASGRTYYEKLRALVAELGLEDAVVFSGAVSEEELRAAYYRADMLVAATHMQTWGLATFEALATGLPVIISKTAGAAEVLTDGEHALLVEPGDPNDIARVIKRLAEDPVLYSRISSEGAAYVRRSFSWDRYARDMRQFLAGENQARKP
ncbi:MAG: glycosyltransferase family 4 protein [Patescibacteria group bacterium]